MPSIILVIITDVRSWPAVERFLDPRADEENAQVPTIVPTASCAHEGRAGAWESAPMPAEVETGWLVLD